MRFGVWTLFSWLFALSVRTAVPSSAPIPETLQYIPFNFQNDTRQLKTAAELQTECSIWEGMVQQGSYGTHQLTCHVWPYVTIPYDKPTNPDGSQCTTAMGFAADTAARQAGYAIGAGSATNYLFYRAPMDNNGGDVCSHRNAWTGMYGVTLFQYAEAELWLSTVKGIHCCSWTEVFSNAGGNAFVTLKDVPPNIAVNLHTNQRNYFAWTGQGHGSWTAQERLGFGYLTQANFLSVTGAPPTGQSQTYTIVPMDDAMTDTISKRAIIFNDFQMRCEARLKPESVDWNEGLVCFDIQNDEMVDLPPLPSWQGGSVPSMTSVTWALPVGGSYVDPTNHERITLMALTSTAATVRLDHASDAPPCTVSSDGLVASTITDAACAVWTLGAQAPNWPAGERYTLKDGVSAAGGIGDAYVPCAGIAHVHGADGTWFRWNGSGWAQLSGQQPCGPTPPPVTWQDVTSGPVRVQQSSTDPTKYRACSVDLSKCTEFVWQ